MGRSGAFVFVMRDRNKKYILKIYSNAKFDNLQRQKQSHTNTRALREILTSCVLSQHAARIRSSHFIHVYQYGEMIIEHASQFKTWFKNTKLQNQRCSYVLMDFVQGKSMADYNDKENLLAKFSDMQLRCLVRQIRESIIQFQDALTTTGTSVATHMDLHPGNIILQTKKISQGDRRAIAPEKITNVILIDFDLTTYEKLKRLHPIETGVTWTQKLRTEHMPSVLLSKTALLWSINLVGRLTTFKFLADISGNAVKTWGKITFDEVNIYFICKVLKYLMRSQKNRNLCPMKENEWKHLLNTKSSPCK